MTKKDDLKMILSSIQTVRERWLALIEKKRPTKENPNDVFMDAEVNEEFNNLINLYGILGQDAAEYLEVLSEDVVIKKAA